MYIFFQPDQLPYAIPMCHPAYRYMCWFIIMYMCVCLFQPDQLSYAIPMGHPAYSTDISTLMTSPAVLHIKQPGECERLDLLLGRLYLRHLIKYVRKLISKYMSPAI